MPLHFLKRMLLDKEKLEKLLCSAFCAEIHLRKVAGKDFYFLESPFTFPDGDSLSLYVKDITLGIRITDLGHTIMHLSYENEIDDFFEGTRGKLFEQILSEFDIKHDEGELFVDTTADDIVLALFRIGQALTRITDLTFLNRARVESTFYEDLHNALVKIATNERVEKDYIHPGLENAENYPIDFRIKNDKGRDLFVFGVPNRDKARLATIILSRLTLQEIDFESLTVFENFGNIPRRDVMRLGDVGGEMVSSLDAYSDLNRKVQKRIMSNGHGKAPELVEA